MSSDKILTCPIPYKYPKYLEKVKLFSKIFCCLYFQKYKVRPEVWAQIGLKWQSWTWNCFQGNLVLIPRWECCGIGGFTLPPPSKASVGKVGQSGGVVNTGTGLVSGTWCSFCAGECGNRRSGAVCSALWENGVDIFERQDTKYKIQNTVLWILNSRVVCPPRRRRMVIPVDIYNQCCSSS